MLSSIKWTRVEVVISTYGVIKGVTIATPRNQGMCQKPQKPVGIYHPFVCERLLKSQVSTFSREDLKKAKCFLCAAESQSKDSKHPDHWWQLGAMQKTTT